MALNANTVLIASDNGCGRAYLRFNGTGTVQVAKAAANSDIAESSNTAANVIGASISALFWTVSQAGTITIARGANTILVLSDADDWNRASGWPGDPSDLSANLVVTYSAGAASNGTLYVELSKKYGS